MLIKCSECGGQVSDKASTCPHCGAPLRAANGIFEIVGKWFADRRAKTQEKERIERERLQKKEAEERERKEWQAKLEYERNFNYSSKPYTEPCYAFMDCAKIRQDLCSATSYKDVINALSPFKSVQEGYAANLPWLKEWESLDPTDRTVDVLYVAFCMADRVTCDGFVREGCVLNDELACKALVKLASSALDDRSKAFIDRYVDLSPESLEYYQTHIKWLPIVESKLETVQFYTSLGVKPKIGDEGQVVTSRGHLRSAKLGTNVAQIDCASPLSQALDANDINRIKFLLKWGANPDQWMHCCYRCDAAAGPNSPVSYANPLLLRIQSVDAFKLMTDAGMNWYPDDGFYNLVEHLWRGPFIEGSRLELLNYLYAIGYDKPLCEKRDYYRGIVNKVGTSYDSNVEHIRRWLCTQQWLEELSEGN